MKSTRWILRLFAYWHCPFWEDAWRLGHIRTGLIPVITHPLHRATSGRRVPCSHRVLIRRRRRSWGPRRRFPVRRVPRCGRRRRHHQQRRPRFRSPKAVLTVGQELTVRRLVRESRRRISGFRSLLTGQCRVDRRIPSRRPIDSLPDRPMDRLPDRPMDPPSMGPGPSITPPQGRRPTELQPSDSNSSPFGADGQESFKGSQATPPKRTMPAAEQEIAAAGESFESPLERNHLPEPRALPAGPDKMASAKPEAGPPNPYAYDPKSYAYLRGIVDFDPRDNSWHIIYSPNPDRHDKFGGTLQLMNHPDLKTLRSGDFVYLEGHINTKETDSHGKPKYEIERNGRGLARMSYAGKAPVAN